ncbi:unnamed protein product [Prunus armeniaca]
MGSPSFPQRFVEQQVSLWSHISDILAKQLRISSRLGGYNFSCPRTSMLLMFSDNAWVLK